MTIKGYLIILWCGHTEATSNVYQNNTIIINLELIATVERQK